MKILVTTGFGTGKNLLSAFDGALHDAGVMNYNLLCLSSVVPPNAEIVRGKYVTPEDHHGHKLYVVKAEKRSREAGKFIGAGIGWYQLGDGRGVFVEHELTRDTAESIEADLKKDIIDSLTDLCINRGYPADESKMHMELKTTQVNGSPACVLVMAIYQAEGWK